MSALPLALFRYEAQAEVHCPHDVVVWLDFRRRAYYTSRQKRYALGATGSFVLLRNGNGEAADTSRNSLLGAFGLAAESARAGEASRGWAVVTDEMKSLADQAKQAPDNVPAEISTLEYDIR